MTHSMLKTLALTGALAATAHVPMLAGTPAEARGRGNGVIIKEYNFKQPMDGVEGHVGGGYCSYQRIPISTRTASGKLVVTGWTLRQICQ